MAAMQVPATRRLLNVTFLRPPELPCKPMNRHLLLPLELSPRPPIVPSLRPLLMNPRPLVLRASYRRLPPLPPKKELLLRPPLMTPRRLFLLRANNRRLPKAFLHPNRLRTRRLTRLVPVKMKTTTEGWSSPTARRTSSPPRGWW